MLCPSKGTPVVFMPGQSGKLLSRDVVEKNFVAPHWEVYTRIQAVELLANNRRKERGAGEAIAMIWEDGIGLLFFDGKKFRWEGHLQ